MTIYNSIGTCPICSKPTKYNGKKYNKYCSLSCRSTDTNNRRWSNNEAKQTQSEKVKEVWANRTPERIAEIKNKAVVTLGPEKIANRSAKAGKTNSARHKNMDPVKKAAWNKKLSAAIFKQYADGTRTPPIHNNGKTVKGRFRPTNPSKYRGDPTNIVYRSSWEAKFMKHMDEHPEVLQWQSEEIAIPYRSPVDNRIHRYFVDFLVKTKDGTTLIEIKPLYQCSPPILAEGKKPSQTYKKAVVTYAINKKKWDAARAYAADRGWQFKILTEKELF